MGVRKLLDLGGKVALVTGGSRGIGLQMAEALGEMGASIALIARKQDELDAARAQLEASGVEVFTHAGDISARASIAPLVDAILARWERIDILVNVVGGVKGPVVNPVLDISDEQWDITMNLNLRGTLNCTQLVLPSMMQARLGLLELFKPVTWNRWTTSG